MLREPRAVRGGAARAEARHEVTREASTRGSGGVLHGAPSAPVLDRASELGLRQPRALQSDPPAEAAR